MAKEKFILLSLQEDKAKKLAQIISNESCRKILDALADKDMTATQLSKKLSIPLSTVHYNLQNLVDGGLVVCEEFHFSPKGKEVNHYKLASKYIIIAPKSEDGIMDKLKGLLPVVGVVGAGALALQWSKKFFVGETLFSRTAGTVSVTESAEYAAPAAEYARSAAQKAASDSAAVAGDAMPEMARAAMAPGGTMDTAIGAGMDEGIDSAAGAVMEEAEHEFVRESVKVISERAADATPDVVTKTIEHAPDVVTITTQPSPWQNIALWFVLGAVVALGVYLLVQYVRKK